MNTKSQSRFRENRACLRTKENVNGCYGNLCDKVTGKKLKFGHIWSLWCILAKIEHWLPSLAFFSLRLKKLHRASFSMPEDFRLVGRKKSVEFHGESVFTWRLIILEIFLYIFTLFIAQRTSKLSRSSSKSFDIRRCNVNSPYLSWENVFTDVYKSLK